MNRHIPLWVIEAFRSIPDAEVKLVESSVSMACPWHPAANIIKDNYHLLYVSDLLNPIAFDSECMEVADEWRQEVDALILGLHRLQHPDKHEERAGEDPEEVARTIAWNDESIRWSAMDLWDRHVSPYRIRGDRIYVIVAPRELLLKPRIYPYRPQLFLNELAMQVRELEMKNQRAVRATRQWMTLAALAALLAAVSLWWLATR